MHILSRVQVKIKQNRRSAVLFLLPRDIKPSHFMILLLAPKRGEEEGNGAICSRSPVSRDAKQGEESGH